MSTIPGFVVPSSAGALLDAMPSVLGWTAVAVWLFRKLSRGLAGGWTDPEARWWRKGLFLGFGWGVILIVSSVSLTARGIEALDLTESVRQSATDPRVGHYPTFLAMASGLWGILVLGITQFRRHPDWPALNCRTRICIGMGIGLGTGLAEAILAHLFGGQEPGQLLLHGLGVAMDILGCGVAAMFVSPLPEKQPLKLFLGPIWRTVSVSFVCMVTYVLLGVLGGFIVLFVGVVLLCQNLQDFDLP